MLLGLWLLLVSLLPAATVQAAGGMTIAPASQEVVLTAEAEVSTFELELTNRDNQAQTLRLRAVNFVALDEAGGIAFAGLKAGESETKYGLTSWLSFEKDVVTVAPGQTEKVRITIDNRADLSPGGHYGAVVATPSDPDGITDNSKVDIVPATASLVLLKKLGGEQYSLRLDRTELERTRFGLPGGVSLRFQNTGNVHVVPRGTVTIFQPGGKTIAKGNINEASGAILPETFRTYKVPLTSLAKGFWPGQYQVEVSWRFDGTDQVQESVVKFYYFGKIFYLLLLLLCIILICYVVLKTTIVHTIVHKLRRPPV